MPGNEEGEFGFDGGTKKGLMPAPRSVASIRASIQEAFLDAGEEITRGATCDTTSGGRRPFPAVVPDFKGVAIIKRDASAPGSKPDYGTGVEIKHNTITGVEFHPNGDKYPNIVRLRKRVDIVAMPDDASPAFRAGVGKHADTEEYLKVDLRRKVMQAIGYNGLEGKSTTDKKDLFGYNRQPMASPLGEWTFHEKRAEGSNLQYVFNDDNSALREVNFESPEVKEHGDWR